MSISGDTTLTMPVQPAGNGYGNGGGAWGGDWGAWIILFLIFGMFGWGGFGGFGGGVNGSAGQGALTRGELCQDMNFQSLENAVGRLSDNQALQFTQLNNGLCNLGYQNAQLINGIGSQIASEFRGTDNAICNLGFNMQQGFNNTNVALMQGQNALATQLASCCCETQQNIKDNTVQGVMNTNTLSQQISNCCCENEKIAMQNRFDNAQANCATLQAIDKVGDRIIDYLAADKAQALRDENQALRLAASQQAQNNYLVQQLRPCPTPAYVVANPFGCNSGYAYAGNNCGCNSCGV